MCVQQHGKIQINSSARHDDTFSAAAAAVAHAHIHAAEMVNPVVAVAHHQQTTTTTLLLAPSASQQQQTHHQHHHSLLSAIPQNFLGQQIQQHSQHRSGPATAAAAAATTAAAAAAAKSNPSKRHRERLNGQLECLATLLPFEASVITKLDKLSILRLSVSFLRVKSYFHSLPLLMKEPTLPASSSSALAHQRHSSSLHHLSSSSSSSSATAAAHLYHQQQYQQQQQQQQQQQFYYNAVQPHSSYTAYSNATHSQQHHLQHLYQHQQRNETDFQQQYQHYAAAAAAAVAASSAGGGGSSSSSSAAHSSQQPHSYHQYEASAANRLIAAGLTPEVLSRDSIMQALNGFLFIVQADGEVFYVTRTVEHYLGFHQSDILHQSVFDLVHSEDRHEFQKQLSVLLPGVPLLPPATTTSATDNPSPPAAVEAAANSFPTSFNDLVCSGNIHLLERNFTARFRCLLDNTSGFTRMEVRGRIGTLQGHKMRQTHASSASSSTASSSLAFSQHTALFALCSPFGPPAMLELVARESLFRSKHKMDLEFINMDAKGKSVLGCFYNPNLNPANVGASAAAAGKQNGSKFDTLTADFENATATKQTAAAAKRENAKKDKTARNLVDTGTNEIRNSASSYDPSNADHGDSKVSTLPQMEGKKLYNLIHPDDLRYVMSGHSELLKTGTTGLLAYRVQADVDMPWHWLQSSLRINYKSGRGEFIIATHRALIEEEGKDLLTKRCIAVAFSNLLEYVPNDFPPNTNATSTAQQLAATGSSFPPEKVGTGSSSTTSAADAAQTGSKTSENSAAAAGSKSSAKQQQPTSNVDAATRLIRNRSMNKRPRTTTTTTSASTSTATTTTTSGGAASSSSSAYVTRGKSSLSLANDAANSYETAAAALQHTFHGQSAGIGADYLGNSDTLTSANHQSATTFYNIGGKLYSAAQTPSLSSSSLSPYSTTHNNNNEAAMQAAAAAAAAAAGFMFPNNNNNGSSSSTQTTAAAAAAAAKYSQMLAYQQQQQQQPHYQQDRAANYYGLTGYGQHHHHQYSSATSTAQQPFYAAVEAAQQQQDNGNETDHQNYETEPHNHSSSRYAAANGSSGGAPNSNTNAAAWTSFGNYFNTLSYHQQQQQQQAHAGGAAYAVDNATSTTALSAAAVYNPANSYSYYAMTGARNVAGSSSGVDGFTNTSGSGSSGSSGAASSSMPTAALDVESLKSAIVNNGECPVLAITNGV